MTQETSALDTDRRESRKWHPNASRKIKRRIVVQGKLVLDTPASFSNGETVGTELVILEDALERRPLIPGASIAGALRQYLLSREFGYRSEDRPESGQKSLAKVLFGEALDDGTERMESRVIVSDALGNGVLTRREGVKIAGATRTADEGMLFSAQVWEAGTTFDVRFELVLYEGDSDDLIQAFAAALYALGSGEIPLGGRKLRGYGRLHGEEWKVYDYKLEIPAALSAWLRDEPLGDSFDDFFFGKAAEFTRDQRQYVRIEATLQLCDSLLIRALSDVADHEHLSSDGKPVLSGTSIAGALRARALKIANTVNESHAVTLVDDLFGKHGADGDTDKLTASRLLVEEHDITNGKFDYIQNRVKIDRFTGGAFETALFSERPVFNGGDTVVQVKLELRYPADKKEHSQLNAQTGLLLLVLKDLWTEDLSLGGEASIGRGRLRGRAGTLYVRLPDFTTDVELDGHGLTDMQFATQLETYVDALWRYLEAAS